MSSQTYLACGSSDGAVRIWRDGFHSIGGFQTSLQPGMSTSNFVGSGNSSLNSTPLPSLVTAFQAMKEITPSTRGMSCIIIVYSIMSINFIFIKIY